MKMQNHTSYVIKKKALGSNKKIIQITNPLEMTNNIELYIKIILTNIKLYKTTSYQLNKNIKYHPR